MEKTKKLEILVVEDNPENLAVAKEYFGNRAEYASDYEQAMQMLKENEYPGVITDLCFPEKTGAEPTGLLNPLLDKILAKYKPNFEKEDYSYKEFIQPIEDMKTAKTDLPYGALIVEYCLENNIPVVIASGDHGGRTQLIKQYFEKSLVYNREKRCYNKKYCRLDHVIKNTLELPDPMCKGWKEANYRLDDLMER